MTYASVGQGTVPHLATELFAQRTGIKLIHVPYQGNFAAHNGSNVVHTCRHNPLIHAGLCLKWSTSVRHSVPPSPGHFRDTTEEDTQWPVQFGPRSWKPAPRA